MAEFIRVRPMALFTVRLLEKKLGVVHVNLFAQAEMHAV